MVGGGVGITPIRALMDEFKNGVQMDVFYRVSRAEELILKDELEYGEGQGVEAPDSFGAALGVYGDPEEEEEEGGVDAGVEGWDAPAPGEDAVGEEMDLG